MTERFWETKTLAQMSPQEWEALCDGCGKCCLIGLEDADTGEIYLTDVSCKLLDGATCRCKDYPNRKAKVPDCVQLTPDNVGELSWLPRTCAYRLIHEGAPLKSWHPLISGDPESVHKAGVSVQGKVRSETSVRTRHLIRRITRWD
jgi:uncharacterized cysteine cluster protein YcgN (CxxCxxCC family)